MFPLMEHLTTEFEHYGVKNKFLGIFGGYSWSGGGVRNLMSFAEKIGWELVSDSCDVAGKPNSDNTETTKGIAVNMAAKIRG